MFTCGRDGVCPSHAGMGLAVIADRLIDLAFVAAFLMERTPP
jgi:hypothetical protein